MIEVDARGLSCPLPVMRTQGALLDGPGELTVLVDSGTARANVIDALETAGYSADASEDGDGWRIVAKRAG